MLRITSIGRATAASVGTSTAEAQSEGSPSIAASRPSSAMPAPRCRTTGLRGVNDLRGNVTAIAADRSGSNIYALIGKRDQSGTDRIYLVTYRSVGNNLVQTSEIVVSPADERAALPSITVEDDGTVVLMYETYDGSSNTVHVHVASSTNFGASIGQDVIDYSFVPLTLVQATGSATSNREFGDYVYITSLGNNFYGAFAGRGDVRGHFGINAERSYLWVGWSGQM